MQTYVYISPKTGLKIIESSIIFACITIVSTEAMQLVKCKLRFSLMVSGELSAHIARRPGNSCRHCL